MMRSERNTTVLIQTFKVSLDTLSKTKKPMGMPSKTPITRCPIRGRFAFLRIK